MPVYSAYPSQPGPPLMQHPSWLADQVQSQGGASTHLDILTLVRLDCMAENKGFTGGAMAGFP